jgi:putative tricarboxylic transport membrane protein
MLGSQGSIAVFWSNPLVASIMGLGLFLLFWPLIRRLRAPSARVPAE